MRLSHKYKFIFFCNPKTGSESVRKILNPYSDMAGTAYLERTASNPFYSHITPIETKIIFEKAGWDFGSYHKFVCVRNPWARLVSLYEMILRLEKSPDKFPDFTDWIYTIKPDSTGGGGEDWQRWRKYGAYSLDNFCKDDSGELLVNKIIRLEDMNRDLIPYLTTLNLPNIGDFIVPHINVSKVRDHYTQYYNKETELHVGELYRFDVNEFGYKFGD